MFSLTLLMGFFLFATEANATEANIANQLQADPLEYAFLTIHHRNDPGQRAEHESVSVYLVVGKSKFFLGKFLGYGASKESSRAMSKILSSSLQELAEEIQDSSDEAKKFKDDVRRIYQIAEKSVPKFDRKAWTENDDRIINNWMKGDEQDRAEGRRIERDQAERLWNAQQYENKRRQEEIEKIVNTMTKKVAITQEVGPREY